MLSQDELEQIFNTKFKRVGSVYKALCPFHPERTPSFTYFPHTNSCYCFGCHKYVNLDKYLSPDKRKKIKKNAKISFERFVLSQTKQDFRDFILILMSSILSTEEDLDEYGYIYHYQWFPEEVFTPLKVKIEPIGPTEIPVIAHRIARDKWILNDNALNVLSYVWFALYKWNYLWYSENKRRWHYAMSRATRPEMGL